MLEYRNAELTESSNGELAGYAALFWDVDSYVSAFKPGAFKKSVEERGDRIPLLWSHDQKLPIGKVVELREDDMGLFFRAQVVEETQYGAETMALLRAGVPLGVSFGFETLQQRKGIDSDPLNFDSYSPQLTQNGSERSLSKSQPTKHEVRVKTECKCWEVSPVTFGSNERAHYTEVRQRGDLSAVFRLVQDIKDGLEVPDQYWDAFTELVELRNGPGPEHTTPPNDPKLIRAASIVLASPGMEEILYGR